MKCDEGFHLRPAYTAHGLSRVRGLGELRRKVRAGLSVLRMRPNEQVHGDELRAQVRAVVPNAPYGDHY